MSINASESGANYSAIGPDGAATIPSSIFQMQSGGVITALSVKGTNGYVSDYGLNFNDAFLTDAPQQFDGVTTSGGNRCTDGRVSVIWDIGQFATIAGVKCWTDGRPFEFAWSNDGIAWTSDSSSHVANGTLITFNQSGRYFRFTNLFASGIFGPVNMYETQMIDTNSIRVQGPVPSPKIIGAHHIIGVTTITF